MESSQPEEEDSKSSTEDCTDRKDQVNEDAGTGRFYECVFCKRGFTTAQALGGHMNIHRRDKAKNKQPATPSSISKDFTRSGVSQADTGRPMFYSPAVEPQRNPNMYFPSSDSSTGQLQFKNPWDLNLIEDSPETNLSLQTGPTNIDQAEEEEKQTHKEEDELDLELRLGHDP